MRTRLYGIPISHAVLASRLMLEHKGIEHRRVSLLSGLHPLQLRLAGFRGGTVPALRMEGHRVQGSLAISRFLESTQPAPPLFPHDEGARREVEEAEAWGGTTLQGVPRRLFRWALVRRRPVRRLLAEANRLPAPRLMALFLTPVAMIFARLSSADDASVRADLAALPGLLDHADALVEHGVIGADRPNAATFQIAPSLRLLMNFRQLAPLFESRPSARFAQELLPDYPGEVDEAFPRAWIKGGRLDS